MAGKTLVDLLERSADTFAENIYLLEKTGDEYEGTTYRETREAVHRFAAGLLSLGLAKGDRVGLISEGRNLWVIAEMGILYCGAINVPISVKINELSDLTFRLAHSGCRMVVVSGGQAHKVRTIRNDLPDLELIIHLDEQETCAEDEIFAGDLMARGEAWLASNADEFERIYTSVEENDPANICYTSGTTADPKGIILTHRNYTANVEQGATVLKVTPDWSSLIILPWDHSFGHTVGIYILMHFGARLASIQTGKTPMETLKNIPENIKEVRPTFLLSVPALAANFRKNIEKGVRASGPVAERLFSMAMKNAYALNAEGFNRGRGLRTLRYPLHWLFDKLLFAKIRTQFGGRLQMLFGGGALLDIEMQRFFYALGMPMYQGYGLTESAPIISCNMPRRHKLGSSGPILEGVECRICDEEGNEVPTGEKGEIVARGENIMAGYWRNEEATRQTLRDGWLHTGDIGYFDEEGFLYVLGREKSLLIANDGEKYSPEGIEEAFCSGSEYIDQVMLHNSQDPYTVALIVPACERLGAWLKAEGHSPSSDQGQQAAIDLIRDEIDAYREGGEHAGIFPPQWLPATFALLDEPFTEENGLLNSTMKMVRGKVNEYHGDRLAELYTTAGKDIHNERNRAVVAGLGV